VITVVSIVQGFSYSIADKFKGLGSDSLTVRAYTSFEQAMQGTENRLSMNDYNHLVQHISGVSNMSPFFLPFGDFGTTVKNGSTSAFTRVMAITANYQDANQVFAETGRFITSEDDASRRKVCVIGSKLRENLKLPDNPPGSYIDVGGEWFKVIGVTETRGEMFGMSQDDYALVPFSVGQTIAGNANQINVAITFNVDQIDQMDEIQDRVIGLLRQLHHLKPGQVDDFKVQTAQQLTDTFGKIIDTLTLVLGGIVSVSLLVGGIGIMNIMLVSVTERTREIGICKALGAQRHHILMQFLIEAVLLSVLGGLIGLGLGYLLGIGAAKMIPNFPSATVPWWAVLLSFGFSSVVGIVFGIMPAAKAANLDPIEALRYE
jgi:putative ABC transport system permease protein